MYRLIVIDDEQDILRAISRVFYREKDIELSDDEKVGAKIVQQSLTAPLRQIAANAGVKDISLILNENR